MTGDERAAAALSGGNTELEPAIAEALGALRAVAEVAAASGLRWKVRAQAAEGALADSARENIKELLYTVGSYRAIQSLIDALAMGEQSRHSIRLRDDLRVALRDYRTAEKQIRGEKDKPT